MNLFQLKVSIHIFLVQAIAVTFGEVKFYVRAVSMNVVTD